MLRCFRSIREGSFVLWETLQRYDIQTFRLLHKETSVFIIHPCRIDIKALRPKNGLSLLQYKLLPRKEQKSYITDAVLEEGWLIRWDINYHKEVLNSLI